MKQSWRTYLTLGLLLYVLGLAIQLIALAGQTDPYIDVSWELSLGMVIIYPGTIFVMQSYLMHSGGGSRWVGYVLLVLGVIVLAVWWFFKNFLADLFMPRVATHGLLATCAFALLFAAVVYPCARKAWMKTSAATPSTPASPSHS